MNHIRGFFSLVLFTAFIFGQCSLAMAETGPSDDYADISLYNEYIELVLGVDGYYTYEDGEDEIDYYVAGRYTVLTRTGDPETTDDDNKALVREAPIPCGFWGYFKLKIGDNEPILCGTGDGGQGEWANGVIPVLYDSPMAGQGVGLGGPYIEGVWDTTGDDSAQLQLHISLVRDLVRFEMTVTNTSDSTQDIGLAFFDDIQVTSSDRMELPFLPGIGYSSGADVIDQFGPLLLEGSEIPDVIDTYGDLASPAWVCRNVLAEQDATSPDYVALGEFSELCNPTMWLPDWSPDTMISLWDGSIMLQWKQESYAPGASRTYVTYYGVGAASSMWTYESGTKTVQDSVVAAVQGPRALEFDSVSSATLTDAGPEDELSPNPFTISAYLYNTATDPGPYGLEGASAYLFLPDGLELVTGETAQQEIGDVPINSESEPVTWQVGATGEYSGELEYYVSFKDENGWQQMVSRKILVPAAKQTVFNYGYQLVSVPFGFNDPSVDHVFGLSAGSFRALYYDAADTKSYIPVSQVESGQAFWMSVYDISYGSTKTCTLAVDAAILGEQSGKQSQEQYVELLKGWNMVGNPFVYPMYIGQIMVYNASTNITYTFDEAVKNGWLSRTIYGWNTDRYAYETLRANDEMLVPWQGYWVYAKAPVTLVFRPSVFPGSGVSSLPGGY